MRAFQLNAGSSLTWTVVEDDIRTTAGVSLADKSIFTIGDVMLGPLSNPREDDDSNNSTRDEKNSRR